MVRLPKNNQAGHWTGWFMGDGDQVGQFLKQTYASQGDEGVRQFSQFMREWARDFQGNFSPDLGRVVYAGGDDFLGVIYSKKPTNPISPLTALEWLMEFPQQWQQQYADLTVSMGFVWAGHSIPQRDVLQHCREAEKRAKALGRDRLTLRVVFNSGQFVQWTCPWNQLEILKQYRDRDGKTWSEHPNWSHLYNDWAHLKTRHAIRLKDKSEGDRGRGDYETAIAFFNLYFNNQADRLFSSSRNCRDLIGNDTDTAIIQWIDDLIQVGWQLCPSNS
jgi:CRISPR-associated protein Cmr2